MRLVVLTGARPQHRYVANVLCAALPIAAVIVDEGVPQRRRARFERLLRRYGTVGLVERGALRAWDHVGGPRGQRHRALRRLLGERGAQFERPELVTTVAGLNGASGHAVISAARPDVLLVYGTGIVSGAVLSLARVAALNLHTGLSPHYRGADCAFWPLYDGRPDLVGATVHECTARVDGGRVFGRATAMLEEDDDVESVFVRCVLGGAELYAHVVTTLPWQRLAEVGQVQDLEAGTEYRGADRGLRAELTTRRHLRNGLVRQYVRTIRDGGERVAT